MKEITVLVNGALIKLLAGGAKEAYQKFRDTMKGTGVISDPERVERKIRIFYEFNGGLDLRGLIADWASMTNDNSQEAFEIVLSIVKEFGSADRIAFVESERGKAYIMTEICRLHGKIA